MIKDFFVFKDSNLTSNYFSSQKFFLAKGHLSPDADFPYKEMQDATYYFFNVAPQASEKLFRSVSDDPFNFSCMSNSGSHLTMETGNQLKDWSESMQRPTRGC